MDIVERLRAPHLATRESHEDADEIERLRQQNAELVEALRPFAKTDWDEVSNCERYYTYEIEEGDLKKAKAAIAKATGGE